MFLFKILAILAFSAVLVQAIGYTTTVQFRYWYPQYGPIFRRILQRNCSEEYKAYLSGKKDLSKIDEQGGGDKFNALTQPVVQCILGATSEFVKSNMASAQVMLGLTPTILAILGASSDESALLSVVGKRPLLAMLLAAGSPSVFTSRAFEFKNPVAALHDRKGRYRQEQKPFLKQVVISAAEYLCSLAAMANVATLNWQLGTHSVCAFESEFIFLPAIWGLISICIHVVGNIVLRLRVRRASDPPARNLWQYLRGVPRLLKEWPQSEWRPSLAQTAVRVKQIDERRTAIVLGWVLSTGTVCHIIFGTLIFSSLVFIGPRDALCVVTRYMASVLICRIILMYELSGLREAYSNCEDGSGEDGTVIGEAVTLGSGTGEAEKPNTSRRETW